MKKAALVTGGAIRLGKAIALSLARHGYDIALHYNSSAAAAEETAREIVDMGVACTILQHDLNDAVHIPALIEKAHQAFPHLDLLVNSASGYTQKNIAQTTPEDFDHQFGVNLRAPFFLSQAFAAQVGAGNIINIIDNKVAYNQYAYAAYLLSKKSLAEFTRMAALEFSPGIRVNGVAPGVTLPATTRSEEYIAWRLQGIPLRRQGETAHISQAIISILQNDFITGQVLTVDGGESINLVGQHAGAYDQSKI